MKRSQLYSFFLVLLGTLCVFPHVDNCGATSLQFLDGPQNVQIIHHSMDHHTHGLYFHEQIQVPDKRFSNHYRSGCIPGMDTWNRP